MRKYIVNIAGLNVDKHAMNRLIILSKTWLKKATTKGTPENLEALERIKEGCFFVDGTAYKVSKFRDATCSSFIGSACPRVKIPC